MTALEQQARELRIIDEASKYSLQMQATINTEEPTRMQAFEVGVAARSYFDGYLAAAEEGHRPMRKPCGYGRTPPLPSWTPQSGR